MTQTAQDGAPAARQAYHDGATVLTEARQHLAELRAKHIEALADGRQDAKLLTQVVEAERRATDLADAYTLQGQRYRAALQAFAESEAEGERARIAELAQQEGPLTHRLNAARVEHMAAAAAYETWRGAISGQVGIAPRPFPNRLEGTPAAIRAQMASDVWLVADPLAVEAALSEIEGEATRNGFDGNALATRNGVRYLPVAGSVRLAFDVATGAIRSKELLAVHAIEAADVPGAVRPKPGAAIGPLPAESDRIISRMR